MDDLISRQAAIETVVAEGGIVDSRYLESERIIHESDAVEALSMLPPAQSEQSGEVAFWKKRAKEYEDIILRLVTEQANTKFDSIEITGKHIVFKKSQPERKKGKWIEGDYWSEGVGMGESYGNYYKCSICGKRVQSGYKHCDMNFCPYCGSDMREETEDAIN